MNRTAILVVASLLISSPALAQTAPSSAPAAEGAAPPYPAPHVIQDAPSVSMLMRQNGGSLMKANLAAATINPSDPARPRPLSAGFFAVPRPEPRTIKKHDLVTIIIREESEFRSDGTTDTKKTSTLDAELEEWVKLNLRNLSLQGGGEGDNPPSVKLGARREFKGEGKVDRSDSFIARIQAEVVDVKPNGTFAVQARKRIKTDDEEQEFILTGICRAADLTVDNTVLSTQVYDLALEKTHRGAVRDASKRGFIPRLLDFVNPF